MLNRILFRLMILLAALPVCAGTSPARADFYQGKTITVVTSTGPGGTYDLTARLIARYMPRHIPGQPAMIVQNMPGGGNILATNFMYNIAPKDGTTIATIHSAMPLHQVLDGRGVRYDVGKFNWLGSTGAENELILVWHTAGIKTIQDAIEREVVVGGTGAASGIVIIPRAMNHLLGTKFKIVTGYKTSEDINVAMQRGEVQARAFSLGSVLTQHPDWIKEKKITILAQAGASRAKEFPDVPLLTELARTEDQRPVLKLFSFTSALGKLYVAPPGVPPDRLAILRKAFDATLKDQAFLAEADKLRIDIELMSADEVTQLIQEMVNAPPDVVDKAKAAMASPDR